MKYMVRGGSSLPNPVPQPIARELVTVQLSRHDRSVIAVERDERGEIIATRLDRMSVRQLRMARGLIGRELRNRANQERVRAVLSRR